MTYGLSLAVWPVWHFGHYFMLYRPHVIQKLILALRFYRNNNLCISLVRQISFSIHFISVAHSCSLVLTEDITQIWQDVCHIWKYYIIKCYKMLVILHIRTGIRSFIWKRHNIYCYSPTDYWNMIVYLLWASDVYPTNCLSSSSIVLASKQTVSSISVMSLLLRW